MKRKQFPYVLGGSLLVLAILASLLGLFAYKNLNKIIGSLEDEVMPHYNLYLINKIDLTIQEAEYAMERYVYSNDKAELEKFEDLLISSIGYADTLKLYSSNDALLNKIDSLQNLVLSKGTVLNQVASIDYESMDETFANLKNQLSDIPLDNFLEDTVLRKKRGFLQRIFQKDGRLSAADTLEYYNSKEYKNLINTQLDSIASLSKKKSYERKLKEYSLQQDHIFIQEKINMILRYLEKYELEAIKLQADEAKNLALYTNRYVTRFAVAIPAMLIITLIVLIIYILRTRKYQEVLSISRKNALKMAREKEQFLANMSHELRTPMNAIGGFARLLLKGPINKQQKEYLNIIFKSTEHLTYILNDVLDFSKLQGGKINLENNPFNPKELVEETVRLLEDWAYEKGLKIECQIQHIPKYLIGDAFRLRQILLNLLSNAIKFTHSGNIQIKVKCKGKTETSVQLQFEVIDTGIGIPANRQEQIFNEFEQINYMDKQSGTGLGLTITKKLVTIHQGEITVKSKEGEGTTFTVIIPYKMANELSKHKLRQDASTEEFSTQHVLISDDEEFNRKLLTAICRENKLTFDEAVDGLDALNKLMHNRYDIILMDFRMPKLSGPDVVEKIRKEEGLNKTTPVIGLTATVSYNDIKRAKKAGIDHVLRKPFDELELLKMMGQSMNITVSKKSKETGSNELYSLEGLNKMGDSAFVRDMIETFINNTRANLQLLDQYFENKDWTNMAEVFHKIVAPARHFKSVEVVHLLKNAELRARNDEVISDEEYQKIKLKINELMVALELNINQNRIT